MDSDPLVVRPVNHRFHSASSPFYNPTTYISGWGCFYKQVKYDEALNLVEVATSTRSFADVRMSTQYAFGMHEAETREENVHALWECYVAAINGGVTKEQLEQARVSCTLPRLIMEHAAVKGTQHAATVHSTGGLCTMRERLAHLNNILQHSTDRETAAEDDDD